MTEAGRQESTHREGVPSTAAIGKHPIHPMLVPFPIAFLVGALLSDIAYWQTGDDFWARVSLWLVGVGLVSGLLAAIIGAIDFFTINRAREHKAGVVHAAGNVTAMVITLINLIIRWGNAADAIVWLGLILSLVTALILSVTGWYGGELSYRHKVGVIE